MPIQLQGTKLLLARYVLMPFSIFLVSYSGFYLVISQFADAIKVSAEEAPLEPPPQRTSLDDFYVELPDQVFKIKPSNETEIEVYFQTDEWTYGLYNPFTNTIVWQLQSGRVNKTVEYYQNGCQDLEPDSFLYDQRNCDDFLFSQVIYAGSSIRIEYETTVNKRLTLAFDIVGDDLMNLIDTGALTFDNS